MTTLSARVRVAAAGTFARGQDWFVESRRATYGVSIARIVYGIVIVAFVASNFASRDYLWGPGSVWNASLRGFSAWAPPFTFFSSSDPEWLFTAKFLLLGVAGLALLVGWHSRISAIVVLFLYVSLVSSNSVATDQTDNALRIMLFYLCFTDLGGRWSLDARRRSRREAKGLPARRFAGADWILIPVHNAAIIAIALQIFLIYVVAGLGKVPGAKWQDGTAVYYPLQLQSFTVWPVLNDLASSNALIVNVVTYLTIFVEVFFPALLLQRWTRILALVGILGMHAGIAVFMGLPLFSLSMAAADGIFIRDRTYRAVAGWAAPRAASWARRLRALVPPRGSPRASGAPAKE